MFSFDTNVLAYASDATAGVRHIQAKNLIFEAAFVDAWLNRQSLVEFLRFALHKKKRPLFEARRFLADWRDAFPLFSAADDELVRTLALLTAHQLSVWDAHMLAICDANGCHVLLSEDMTDGEKYGSVRVVNPFNPANAADIAAMLKP